VGKAEEEMEIVGVTKLFKPRRFIHFYLFTPGLAHHRIRFSKAYTNTATRKAARYEKGKPSP
jgi:hypothetical protein